MTERLLVRRQTNEGTEFDPDIVWITVDEVWAAVEFLDGDYRAVAGTANFPSRNYRITVRENQAIKITDTLVWNGFAMAIRSMSIESNRQRYLVMEADTSGGNDEAIP